jgi:hypothetical protein
MRNFVHDQWAPLNHREAMGDGTTRPPNVPMWIPDTKPGGWPRTASSPPTSTTRPATTCRKRCGPGRRGCLLAHPEQVEVEAGKSPAEKYREYGDPRLLVEQAVALVLGDTQEFVVPDAAELPEDAPAEKAAQARAAEFEEWLHDWVDVEGCRITRWSSRKRTPSASVTACSCSAGTPSPAGRGCASTTSKATSRSCPATRTPTSSRTRCTSRGSNATPDGNEWLHRLTYDRRQLPAGQTRRYAYAREAEHVGGVPDPRDVGSAVRPRRWPVRPVRRRARTSSPRTGGR